VSETTEDKKAVERFHALSRQRREILALPPEKALTAILDSPQPAALVHSFPEEDFYFLIHDIGIEDSLELLALAAIRQWEYIVDVEVWQKDRIEIPAMTRWFDLFLKVAPQRFIKWFLNEKIELIEFYLSKNIEVKLRENDQDPSEFGNEYFSFDDVFFIRIRDEITDSATDHHRPGQIDKNVREEFLNHFLKQLEGFDYITFQNILLESARVIPAEVEEEAFRSRNVRLAEKGFVPFDEAIGIYQPLRPRDFEKLSTKFVAMDNQQRPFLPVPYYSVGMLPEENLFARTLKQIEIGEVLEQIQAEFAGLCNHVTAADQKIVRNRGALKEIVKKVCGYLNIGLERLTAAAGGYDMDRGAALIKTYPLGGIFRVGYGLALELKWRVEKWRNISWFESQGLLLSFWDEAWVGVLGGLLLKKPLFFDNYETGQLYREFVSLDDIKRTKAILDEIMAVDELLSLINVEPQPISEGFLTYKNFLLTLWARDILGLQPGSESLTLAEFRRFFEMLWSDKAITRKIGQSMKTRFLDWLADRTASIPDDVSEKLGPTLENLFREIENEYGNVAFKDLDPRYIQLFLIKMK
jgi:hypothetical protein